MLKVNVECVADLTSLALPEMLGCRLGQVVNVASVPGDLVLPTRVLYAASKAFVHALSEGLYRELRGTSVFVTMVNPGAVKTQFQRGHGPPARSPARAQIGHPCRAGSRGHSSRAAPAAENDHLCSALLPVVAGLHAAVRLAFRPFRARAHPAAVPERGRAWQEAVGRRRRTLLYSG